MRTHIVSIIKSLVILLLPFYFFTLSLNAYAADPVKKYGKLQVKGSQLCDKRGKPVILRGVSLGWHNLWPRFYNAQCVETLKKDWHCSVVRAAMGIMIEDNYLENPDYAMQCMTAVIEAAIKQNVYVIIDWHSHEMKTQEAKEFFGRMAQKYGKHPHVIYEIFNEPVEDSWADLKEYAIEVIGEIRRYDPDNIVLVGCPHWDQDIHLVAESPLTGFTNIMYTVHFYAATHGDHLRKRTEDAVKKGLPIFISESGATEASGDGRLDLESEEEWIQMCERLGVSWVCWSISDKNETCSMLLPRATATGPWADDVIKKYGKLVKELLLKYNN
jgi:endoglucanase